ncbi:MAG TPA: aminotransferase class III-fold pyridoxal phosphate-dependent enzyme, partial [Gammaproteobacteria bacterium]|nr:aminotransferase class III-fold pyridoxal phosphate-dependent enzyme [Gammaproteobacteria bacterium]
MSVPEKPSTAAARALEVFPAASNGEFNLPPELAIVIAGGEGCELWDTEGRRYLDFSMGWGSSLVGHARPEVVSAV